MSNDAPLVMFIREIDQRSQDVNYALFRAQQLHADID